MKIKITRQLSFDFSIIDELKESFYHFVKMIKSFTAKQWFALLLAVFFILTSMIGVFMI